MTIEKLERVMWRVRKLAETNKPTHNELRRAIMYECGTDPSTYYNNKKALKILGWIIPYNKSRYVLTGKDLIPGNSSLRFLPISGLEHNFPHCSCT